MADQNSTIKTTVVLDVTQAQQQIVKLNAVASDSTKSLEERVEAKNKQVEIQEKLSKQSISNLQKEIKGLEKLEGTEKDIIKVQSKLNKEKIKATKLSENGAKQQAKLTEALEDSKDSMKNLDDATGGVIGKFKAFIANPIGLTLAALAGLFKIFQEAVERSSAATTAFDKVGTKLSGMFNGLMAVLEPVVTWIGETLLTALENPKQAILDLGNSIKENIINRFKAFLVLGDAFSALMDGDFKKAAKLGADAFIQMGTGIENATDKFVEFTDKAKVAYNTAAEATEKLVDSERRLAENRIALEKQQLESLRLAELQRQIRDDTSRSIEERIEANKRLGDILVEQSLIEQAIAQQNLDLALAQQAATGDTIENLEAVGDAEIKLLEIQERITGQRSEQLVNEIGLLREKSDATAQEVLDAEEKEKVEKDIRDRNIEANIQLDELELERKRNQGEKVLELELAILNKRKAQELSNTELTESERAVIIAKYAQAEEDVTEASDKSKTDSKEIAKDQAIGFAAEAFGISREVAIAEQVMNAPKAVANSFTQAAKAYNPPISLAMGALGAAGVIVPIIKGLADIKKVRFPGKTKGKSVGGGTSGSISASTSAPPITSSIEDISANNSARLGIDPSIGSAAGADAANNVVGGASTGVIFSEEKYSDFQDQVAFKEDKTTI